MLLALAFITAQAGPPNPCFRENNPRMLALQAALDEAIAYAEADEAANGVTGTYALASVYALDSLMAAQADLDAWRAFTFGSGGGDNAPTQSYAEAAASAQYLDRMTDSVQLAMWWSAVSTAWHVSQDARWSLEAGADVQGIINGLRLGAYVCYTNAYLVP
jgi:hypothetical protein